MASDDSTRGGSGRERRRTPRIEVLSPFQGHSVTLGVPVTLMDISLGGFRIETSVVFPIGAIHEFRFTLGDDTVIEVRTRVLRCGIHTSPRGGLQYSVGLEFVNGPANAPKPDVLRLIEEIRSSAVFNLQ